jgi:hypothetical protein
MSFAITISGMPAGFILPMAGTVFGKRKVSVPGVIFFKELGSRI